MTLCFSNPFALSLSKPVLSNAAGGVEGGRLGQLCFDKLSTDGVGGYL